MDKKATYISQQFFFVYKRVENRR